MSASASNARRVSLMLVGSVSPPLIVVNVDVRGLVRDPYGMPDRRARLLAALGFLELQWRGLKPDAAGALERWLHSWRGFGDVITGMSAQGFDVELRQHGVNRPGFPGGSIA